MSGRNKRESPVHGRGLADPSLLIDRGAEAAADEEWRELIHSLTLTENRVLPLNDGLSMQELNSWVRRVARRD